MSACVKFSILMIFCNSNVFCRNGLIEYMGHEFPLKYLTSEDYVPTYSDITNYMHGLNKTVNYLTRNSNDTDHSRSIGLFLLISVLKNTLVSEGFKLKANEHDILTRIMKRAEDDVSHYVYIMRINYDKRHTVNKIALMYREVILQAQSLGDFHGDTLKKWILNKSNVNQFAQSMDNLTLPKDKYVELVDSMEDYYMSPDESDECLGRIAYYNPVPIAVTKLRPCRESSYCWYSMHSSPSVAYALSHRFLNILLRRTTRLCYLRSEKEDNDHMDELCAAMYREAVYIARRGFFARDLFLEHIALCAFRGYKEFHRQHWFKKVTSWINEDGCIAEFHNYNLNMTSQWVNKENDRKGKKELRDFGFRLLESECHEHPMVLLAVVLAHAIRHTLHYMPKEGVDKSTETAIRLDL